MAKRSDDEEGVDVCVACGDPLTTNHHCDPKKIARRNSSMVADRLAKSRGLSESDRITEGFKMLAEAEDENLDDQ